jgi:hypothetical protein
MRPKEARVASSPALNAYHGAADVQRYGVIREKKSASYETKKQLL